MQHIQEVFLCPLSFGKILKCPISDNHCRKLLVLFSGYPTAHASKFNIGINHYFFFKPFAHIIDDSLIYIFFIIMCTQVPLGLK